jgi:hypothetical protein
MSVIRRFVLTQQRDVTPRALDGAMSTADRRLAALATGQLGAFNRRQAHVAGLTDHQLRSRIQSGFLDQFGPNGFRSPYVAEMPLASLVALMLDIGEPCWASGATAAALHGFDGFRLAPPFDVTILRGRDVHRRAARVHTTKILPLIDQAHVGEIAVTSGARTLIDLARSEGIERLTIAFDSGLRDGKYSEDLVHRRIVALRSPGRYGMDRLLAAIEGHDAKRGGHSWLERRFLALLAEAGLPRPITQQILSKAGDRLVRVDCRFPGTRVVVELLGYRWHRTRQQLNRDTERVNSLIADGFQPYQFTYDQVTDSPATVLETVRAALAGSCVSTYRSATDIC